MREVEVDTDADEAPASPPLAQRRAEDEQRNQRTPRKRKWDERPAMMQPEEPVAPSRSRPTHELCSRPKQKARKLVLPTSSAEEGRTTARRNVLPTQEEVVAQILGRPVSSAAQKAKMPSEDVEMTSSRPTVGRRGQHAGRASMPEERESLAAEPTTNRVSPPAEEACEEALPVRRPSGEKTCRAGPASSSRTTSNRTTVSRQDTPTAHRTHPAGSTRTPPEGTPSAETTSARIEPEVSREGKERAEDEGRAETTTPEPPTTEQPTGADAPAVGSPTALDILAGSGAAVAEEEAARPSPVGSPGTSVATEILETDEDTSSEEEQEVESVKGTPTAALCEQVVPLLRYLDGKMAKYASRRYPISYVELIRNRTRTKVGANPKMIALDSTVRDLSMKNDALREGLGHLRKWHKTFTEMRDERIATLRKECESLELQLNEERTQTRRL